MDYSHVEELLDQDIGPHLTMEPGVGHTLEEIRIRVRTNYSDNQSWLGYVVTSSFKVFFYYGSTHDEFNTKQGLTADDILLSGYFFPASLLRGVNAFRLPVRGEGVIDFWMHRQQPLSEEQKQKYLRFKSEVGMCIYEFICSLRE